MLASVRVIQGFALVPERITRHKVLSYLSCGFGPDNVGFNYPMMCKAIERLSEGVTKGNGDEYAKDLSRLAHVTSRSAIFPEMRELVMNAFDGDKQLFVRPEPSLFDLFREWDSISDFIRAGGVGDMLIGGRTYSMDDFRLMISLINSGDLKAKVDGSALAGKNVGGCAKGNAKVDGSALAGKNVGGCAKSCAKGNGKLTNVESSGTAANKWNKKGSTSASKGAWNTPAEEETWGSVGEGSIGRNCSLGADGSKSGGHGSGSIGRALCTRMP